MLRPRKVKDIMQSICEKKGLPFEDMSVIIPAVYEETRSKLVGYDHLFVKVEGLGTFVALKGKTEEEISELEKKLKTHFVKNNYAVKMQVTERLVKMKAMVQRVEDFFNEKHEVKAIAKKLHWMEEKPHIPSYYQYNIKGCRCEGCKRCRGAKEKRYTDEKKRIKALKEKKDGKDKGTLGE